MAGKVVYTAEATVQGGREGRGRTSDGLLDVDLRPPGGNNPVGGTNPEQLFAVGFGACFENAVRVIGRRRKLEIEECTIDVKVHLTTADDRAYNVAVELHSKLPGMAPGDAIDLIRAAHAICPYSNATRGNIDLTLTANGQPVEG